MRKAISILDKDYKQWLAELSSRYHRSQIKAAVKVNEEMLRFYWELGKDIVQKDAENKYGSKFFSVLSRDLKEATSTSSGLSERNIRYAHEFYLLYSQEFENLQQLAANSDFSEIDGKKKKLQQPAAKSDKITMPPLVAQIQKDIFSVPWGHHILLIDKFKNNRAKALFFVQQTVQNGWSRNMLLNFLGSDLYERQGKALTNFSRTLPDETSDLAQELTKDPYDFAFTGITGRYNERLLKDRLLNNITQFLVELGTGFAYVGREYRLQVGEREQIK